MKRNKKGQNFYTRSVILCIGLSVKLLLASFSTFTHSLCGWFQFPISLTFHTLLFSRWSPIYVHFNRLFLQVFYHSKLILLSLSLSTFAFTFEYQFLALSCLCLFLPNFLLLIKCDQCSRNWSGDQILLSYFTNSLLEWLMWFWAPIDTMADVCNIARQKTLSGNLVECIVSPITWWWPSGKWNCVIDSNVRFNFMMQK